MVIEERNSKSLINLIKIYTQNKATTKNKVKKETEMESNPRLVTANSWYKPRKQKKKREMKKTWKNIKMTQLRSSKAEN